MKISKLIQELEKKKNEFGDLDVNFVSDFYICTCQQEYCYCTSEEYLFTIESIDKRTLPKCGKMDTIGISIRGTKD